MNVAPAGPGETGRLHTRDDEAGPLDGCGDGGDDGDGRTAEAGAPHEMAQADDGRPTARAAVGAAVTDAELAAWLDAIAAQDQRALAALYDATVNRVYAFVRRVVRHDTLAEEAVEDTYFQVWRQAVRYDGTRGTAMAWLLAMARSRALDVQRREHRLQHEPLDEDDGAETPDESPLADELIDASRDHAELQHALMRLGAQPRQLVSLAFFRGLSHEEIADQMRLPLGTVKSQIRRALLTLRSLLRGGPADVAAAS